MTATSLPSSVRARVAPGVTTSFANVEPVSATYRITPSGKLPAPARLRIPLKRRLPRGVPVLAARAEGPRGPWIPVSARISADRRFALVRVTELSWFSVFTTDVGDILRELKEGVLDGLTAGLTAEAKPPTCIEESRARTAGYSISSDSKDTVYWCFGMEAGSRVLRVVNNRRYPLALTHAGLPVIQQGGGGLKLERLSRIASGAEAIVSPREQVVFSVELSPGGSALVRSRFDGVGWSLYQLQFGAEAALAILTRFGIGSGLKTVDLINKLVTSSKCLAAIGDTAGDVIRSCLSPKQLFDALGAKALLIAPIMVSGQLLSFVRSWLNGAGDQLNDRDSYHVAIRRTGAPQPPVAATPPPPPPQPQAPTSSFEIGADFDLRCQVAWPTAPTRTTNSIEMTMQCPGIPSEFLLVYVSYGDPDLPITPSTGPVRVRGKVVNHAQNELGFKLLVVVAESVEIP
jgi:hypothetical protein